VEIRGKSEGNELMNKLYFCIFEPVKYSWKLFLVQLAIQIRTWRKATHVGMLWSPESDIQDLIDYLWEEQVVDLTTLSQQPFYHAGTLISATWPKVKLQNIFEDYKNDRVFIRSIEVPHEIAEAVREEWKKRLDKEGYSIGGLLWFVVGPVMDLIIRNGDVDPKNEFCSEAVTNVLYSCGVPVFHFAATPTEQLILKIRKLQVLGLNPEQYLTFEDKYLISMTGKSVEKFVAEAKLPMRGYKISPGVFKINPLFNTEIVLEITKTKVRVVP